MTTGEAQGVLACYHRNGFTGSNKMTDLEIIEQEDKVLSCGAKGEVVNYCAE